MAKANYDFSFIFWRLHSGLYYIHCGFVNLESSPNTNLNYILRKLPNSSTFILHIGVNLNNTTLVGAGSIAWIQIHYKTAWLTIQSSASPTALNIWSIYLSTFYKSIIEIIRRNYYTWRLNRRKGSFECLTASSYTNANNYDNSKIRNKKNQKLQPDSTYKKMLHSWVVFRFQGSNFSHYLSFVCLKLFILCNKPFSQTCKASPKPTVANCKLN